MIPFNVNWQINICKKKEKFITINSFKINIRTPPFNCAIILAGAYPRREEAHRFMIGFRNKLMEKLVFSKIAVNEIHWVPAGHVRNTFSAFVGFVGFIEFPSDGLFMAELTSYYRWVNNLPPLPFKINGID